MHTYIDNDDQKMILRKRNSCNDSVCDTNKPQKEILEEQ